MTSRLLHGTAVGSPPSWPRVRAGHFAAGTDDPAVGDLRVGGLRVDRWADPWVDREFAAIVAANWPAQDQPAPRRRRTRVGTLAAPRQPDNRRWRDPGFGDGGRSAGAVVDAADRVVSRQRSPPHHDPTRRPRRTEYVIEKCGREPKRERR